MTWFSILKEEEIFFHATDYDNLSSIMAKGIVPGIDGVVYSAENGHLSTAWMCMTRPQTKKVISIPYKADMATHRLAGDHSPFMLEVLGAKLEETSYNMDTKVYETTETIKPEQIFFDKIKQVDNPCYNAEFAEKFNRRGRE